MRHALVIAAALAVAGCASVQVNPREVATTHAPFEASIGFARVAIPAEAPLVGAKVDGAAAFCTPFPAYFAPGEHRGVCFSDPEASGYLTRYYVLGTIRSASYPARIPYTLGAPPSPAPAQTQRADAIRARCDYQAQAAAAGVTGDPLAGLGAGWAGRGIVQGFGDSLNQAVTAAHLRTLCLRAAAAEQQ